MACGIDVLEEKIKQSKDEKTIFLKAMAGHKLPPVGMHHDIYLAAVVTLHQKVWLRESYEIQKTMA